MSPADNLQFLERYAVAILPVLVVAEQIGVPLPAVPALLAVGALAAQGRTSIPMVLGAISVVALVVDFGWYELGRRRGAGVLARLCRLSLEPDSCVRRAETIFTRHGPRGLLVAKFFPGLTTVMPPLAGVFAVARGWFALYDLAGVLLWAGTWLAIGYFFSDAIVLIAARATALTKAELPERQREVVGDDEQGRTLFSKARGSGPNDGLLGFTGSTVTARYGSVIYAHDEKGMTLYSKAA